MKKLHKLRSLIGGLALGAALLASAPSAKAANAYFTTAAAGPYSWDGANWSTVVGGPFTSTYVSGSFPRFNGTGTYTITCNAVESMAGMFANASTTLNITNAGTGGFSILTTTASATQNGFSWLTQGFFTAGGTINLSLPISGVGGVGQNSGGGNLNLYGSNSFTGGFLVNSSGTFVGYNNSNSFGANSSQIGFNGTGFAIMNNTGPTTVNIANPVQTIGVCGVNFIGNSCTMSGNWYLGGAANAVNLRNNGLAGAVVTLAGVLSATTGNVGYSSQNGTTILLTKNNTYTGLTTVGVASSLTTGSSTTNITVEIAATGSLAGSVSNVAILKLDGVANLKTNATLFLAAGGGAANSVNLNYSGTQPIANIYFGGVVQAGGTWGPIGSAAQNQNAAFTGTGLLSTPAAPAIVSQPQPVGAFPGATATFNVTASGAAPLSYQWKSNGIVISGATSATYSFSPVASNSGVGPFSVNVSNSVGNVNSSDATLTVLATNAYTTAITGDSAISYWRLGETNGTVALDSISTNNGTYINVTLNQPGFSLTDANSAIGLPASTNSRGYVIVSNSAATFNFTSANTPFTMECWAYFTNLTGVQRLFSTLGNGNGYAFGINGNNVLRFTQGAVQDADFTMTNSLVAGVWNQLVVTCDGSIYSYYVNSNLIGTVTVGGVGVPNNGVGFASVQPLVLGANGAGYPFASEQVFGKLDEMAIYNTALSATQVAAHYAARYGTLAAPIVTNSIATPATNYASLSSTIQSVAAGQLLSYQWYQTPSTLLSGQTNATLTIAPLVSSASYYVQVSNPVGTSNSPAATITVLPIPTNATMLNLTNALVLHLPFDGSLSDVSGRNNNGTNVGATSFVSPGAVGTNALHYSSDTNASTFNYVTLGVVPDLQFSSNVNFSVSYWIRQPVGSTFTNLPFFTDAVGSTGNGGFAFAPYANTGGGGWMWTAGSVTSPNVFTTFSDLNLINDGNWHSLIHVADRSANLTTYLDGVQVDSQAINFIGSINTANAATIGQDPTGTYAVTASADIDDLGVWQRTLTSLEVSGIYLAGATNSVSFAPSAVVRVPVALTVTNTGGVVQISWTGAGTLQSATSVTGPYTDVAGATSPYTVSTVGAQVFYRLR